jgi:hypothetical protein
MKVIMKEKEGKLGKFVEMRARRVQPARSSVDKGVKDHVHTGAKVSLSHGHL